MTRPEVLNLILDVIKEDPRAASLDGLDEDTRLFGKSSVFDSLGLAMIVAETEARINDCCGTSLILASDRAMSRQQSPFRTPASLADYICELLEGARES